MYWIVKLFRHQIIPSLWFFLTLSFILLSSIYIVYDFYDYSQHIPYIKAILFKLLPLLWGIIFLERLLTYILIPLRLSWRQRIYQYFLASLFPPLRLSHVQQQQIWLFGWKSLETENINKIESFFTYPVLLIALIILLPAFFLTIWIPSEFITQQSWFMHSQLLAMSVIISLWTVELIIMLGISRNPLQYIVNHWLDLFIYIFPLAALNRLIHVFGLQAYYNSIDTYIVRFMFLLKIVFLGLSAVLIHYAQTDEGMKNLRYMDEMLNILFVLWAAFALERIIYLSLCPNKTWRSFVGAFFIVLFPPLHLAARRCHTSEYIWYFTHWELVREELFEKIDRQFLFWILVVLIIMTPFWLLDFIFTNKLKDYILLQHMMNLGNAVVWAVFVAEFIIEISITKKWQQYLIKHWIELLIILLPMLAFVRFLRFAHLGSLSQFGFVQKMIISYTVKWQKLLNIYRARSTLNRLIRIVILIEAIQRWQQSRNPVKYLQKLQEQLQEKQQELDNIKRKIRETEQLIADNQK